MTNVIQPDEIVREPNIVNMMFGSHLYGLDTPDSDVDYKGVYMPDLHELLLNNYAGTYKHSTGGQHEKNAAGDIDTEVISLPKFIKHACDGETFAIDMLHCENPLSSHPIWEELVANRRRFYSKSLKAYMGYVKKQAAKYGLKGTRLADIRYAMDALKKINPEAILGEVSPDCFYFGEYVKWVTVPATGNQTHDQQFYEVNMKKYQSTNSVGYVLEQLQKMWDGYGARAKQAEQNDGVDWKALSHALRAGYQARDIYTDGDFTYPLKETDFLLAVKRGQLDYKTEVAPELERLVAEVDALADASDLPAKVDRQYWGLWLLQKYSAYHDIEIMVRHNYDNFAI